MIAFIKKILKKVWGWVTNRWTAYISIAVWLLFFNTVSAYLAFTSYLKEPLDLLSFSLVMLIYLGLSFLWGYVMPAHEDSVTRFRTWERKKLTRLWNDIEFSAKRLEQAQKDNQKLKDDLLKGEVEVVMIRHKRKNVIVINGEVYTKSGKVQ